MRNNIAALVIDMQTMFLRNLIPPTQADEIIAAQVNVLRTLRESGMGTILIEASMGGSTIPQLRTLYDNLRLGERYETVAKSEISGLTGEAGNEVQKILERWNCRDIIPMGVYADRCVLTTAMDGKKLGYRIHTSRDLMDFTDMNENYYDALQWYANSAATYTARHDELLSRLGLILEVHAN